MEQCRPFFETGRIASSFSRATEMNRRMSKSAESHSASASSVTVTDDTLTVELRDGRAISAPLACYPRLLHGTAEERARWRLVGQGDGLHWPDLDEDISVKNHP